MVRYLLFDLDPYCQKKNSGSGTEYRLCRSPKHCLEPGDVAPVLLLRLPAEESLGSVARIVEGAVLVEDQADPGGIGTVRVAQRRGCVHLMFGNLPCK